MRKDSIKVPNRPMTTLTENPSGGLGTGLPLDTPRTTMMAIWKRKLTIELPNSGFH